MKISYNPERDACIVEGLPGDQHTEVLEFGDATTAYIEDDDGRKTHFLTEDGELFALVPVAGLEIENDVDLDELLGELDENDTEANA